MFKFLVHCPNEQYLDLIFGKFVAGTDLVEFAATGQGLLFDQFVNSAGDA